MAILNVRIFTDDLEDALSRYLGVPGLRMRPDPTVHSLFTSYFNAKFTLTIGEISFRTELLYDIFDDQRNIMRILHTSTDEYQMYYSIAGAPETHVFRARD